MAKEESGVRINNIGKRAFILSPKSVLKGGEITDDKVYCYINPGDKVVVTEEAAKKLSTYPEILIVGREKE